MAGFLLGVEACLNTVHVIYMCPHVNVHCSLRHLWYVLRVRMRSHYVSYLWLLC